MFFSENNFITPKKRNNLKMDCTYWITKNVHIIVIRIYAQSTQGLSSCFLRHFCDRLCEDRLLSCLADGQFQCLNSILPSCILRGFEFSVSIRFLTSLSLGSTSPHLMLFLSIITEKYIKFETSQLYLKPKKCKDENGRRIYRKKR